MAPRDYISSTPSKGVRPMLILALNDWIKAPQTSVKHIKNLIRLLHDASLLIDDVQDNSTMRRGKPAAHVIFGAPQALNTGLFMFSQAVRECQKLKHPRATNILIENLECLYLGQSWDLYWKHNLTFPSEDDYFTMVDNKTGGMFRMLVQLLQVEGSFESSAVSAPDLERLILLLGRFFQVRDDYMNLSSADYAEQKGFCEDLDEGKISYLIVRLLAHAPEYKSHITGIFRQLPLGLGQASGLPYDSKRYILDILQSTGTFAATLQYLKDLQAAIEIEISRLEGDLGEQNPMIRLIIANLSVKELVK
ncbi:geranylgeranyl pyrophosphate synthase [Penicillium argentinense]|uniref:Geranylgeranyl pyrophosphate synthase n=1 Tax=Penicillium argentinense TaxID=1131581 RepID=A0A9W9G0K9_9EURO|nr:geranylgeranyl pyrophosphate synthase [Penicillium argentinense]KAJ5109931.1 geranylgeranyl pyrophosphate synthase [Penicillium argentinense]